MRFWYTLRIVMQENTKRDSVHVIGRLAPNPRLGVPQGGSRGGKYNWIIIANKRREREPIVDVRAGEKGRPRSCSTAHDPSTTGWLPSTSTQHPLPTLISFSLTVIPSIPHLADQASAVKRY
jgi:hypothetical protein